MLLSWEQFILFSTKYDCLVNHAKSLAIASARGDLAGTGEGDVRPVHKCRPEAIAERDGRHVTSQAFGPRLARLTRARMGVGSAGE